MQSREGELNSILLRGWCSTQSRPQSLEVRESPPRDTNKGHKVKLSVYNRKI